MSRQGMKRVLCGSVAAWSTLAMAASAWALDVPINRWVPVTPDIRISGVTGSFDERRYTKMVFSPFTNTFITWDGFINSLYPDSIYSNALWSYDAATNILRLEKLTNWHNVGGDSYTTRALPQNSTDPTPADRHPYGAMAYVPEKKAVYIWGGANRTLPDGHPTDTWRYSLETRSWINLNPASHPPVTLEASMAYDPDSRTLVMFGGDQDGAAKTYAYDLSANTWSQVSVEGTKPTWRMGHALVYDPIRKAMLMFGGGAYPGVGNELWSFDIATRRWTQIVTSVTPPPRKLHAFAYDSRNDVFVLIGGRTSENGGGLFDTWAYLPNAKRWERLADVPDTGASPHRVDMDFDPRQNVFMAHFEGRWFLYRYAAASSGPTPSSPTNLRVN